MNNKFKLLIISSMLASVSSVALANVNENNVDKVNFVQLNTGISKSLKPKGDYKKGSLGNSSIYGLEFGREVYKGLRLSFSIDHRHNYKNQYSATDAEHGFFDYSKVKVKSTAFLLNSYFDIYEFSGLKPYLGLGFGIARNTPSPRKINFPAFYGDVDPEGYRDFYKAEYVEAPGKASYNFAYKFAAGARYNVTDFFSVDLRYQYSDLGKFKSHNYEYQNGDKLSSPIEKGKLKAHEFMLGLGYNF